MAAKRKTTAARKKKTTVRKRRYSPSAGADVAKQMRELKRGTGRATTRKQAVAIGLAKARRKGKKVPTRARK